MSNNYGNPSYLFENNIFVASKNRNVIFFIMSALSIKDSYHSVIFCFVRQLPRLSFKVVGTGDDLSLDIQNSTRSIISFSNEQPSWLSDHERFLDPLKKIYNSCEMKLLQLLSKYQTSSNGGEFIKTQSDAQKNGRWSDPKSLRKTPSVQDPLPFNNVSK
jgi:hypothetical protein